MVSSNSSCQHKRTTKQRMTVDMTKLNNQVEQKLHPTETLKATSTNVNGAEYFSTFYATKG